MREILFKAYIKTLQWVVPVARINFDFETVEVDLTDGNGDTAEYDFDEIILMQYTGLKDKNGTKVFEGDICKGSWKHIIQIFYDDCIYGFCAKTSEGFCHNIDYWGLDRIEVIGNRYDNPELLKECEQ